MQGSPAAVNCHCSSRAGVGNLRPTWTFDMARIRIFVSWIRL